MSDTAPKHAATPLRPRTGDLELEQVTATPLREPAQATPSYDPGDAAMAEEIERRVAEIDMADANSIVGFGARSQSELQSISQAMLADVRNKDAGPAGQSLRDMVSTLRGFSAEELDPNRKQSWWEKLVRRAGPMARFAARFEEVRDQIDRITGELERHEHALLKDIKSLDVLYDRTLAFYDELGLYIAAGSEKLARLDRTDIPAKQAEVDAAPEDEAMLRAQELRDLRAARDDLDRRVHDLKLTRQVTMQSLPSIRLVQENDKALVTKINSTLVNTVPLWETQLAQGLTIRRSQEAADAVRGANDLTNELLKNNAKTLRQSNRAVREEMERGVFDIETVKAANAELIATIEESLQIADEARTRRSAAEDDLQAMEGELRQALSSASARGDRTGAAAGGAVPGR